MMRIQPMYAENIIVGILYENSFGWYSLFVTWRLGKGEL